jgi:hypothetical protein
MMPRRHRCVRHSVAVAALFALTAPAAVASPTPQGIPTPQAIPSQRGAAQAAASVPVSVAVFASNGPALGRLTIAHAGDAAFAIAHDGNRVTLRFNDSLVVNGKPRAPRNVRSIMVGDSTIDMTVADGARIQSYRSHGNVILDILDPPPAEKPKPEKAAFRGRPGTFTLDHPSSLSRSAELGGRTPGMAAPASAAPASMGPTSMAPTSMAPMSMAPLANAQASSTPAVSSKPTAAPQTAASQTPVSQTLDAPTFAATLAPTPAPAADPPNASTSRGAPPPPQTDPEAATPALPVPVQTAALPSPLEPDPDITADRPLPPGRDTLPGSADVSPELLVRRIGLPRDIKGAAFLVPFAATAGAAVFDDGSGTSIVFDERRPIDMSALRNDPDFSGVSVQLLAKGTRLHVPQPAGTTVSLTPMLRGWRVAVLPAAPPLQAIGIDVVDRKVNLVAEAPGDVLTMADPQTGATLLIGTQHHPGAGVLRARHTVEFDIRTTRMGVVVEPFSDEVAMNLQPAGFRLTGGPGGLHVSNTTDLTNALLDAADLKRRFNFSVEPPEALLAELDHQVGEAAAAPPQTRGQVHHRMALTMLALGMGAEAKSMLDLAAAEDPAEASSPDAAALGAIAALLAGRVGESDGITDPRLDGTDEIALWRGVRAAMLDQGSPAAAANFATTAPLAAVYPAAIRDRILPLIVETMLEGGEIGGAKHIMLRRPTDPRLAYARALLRQAEGDTDGALGQLDQLANGRDQFDRARAAMRAVEVRLAAHRLDAAQAADALDKLLYAWRGDLRELALRERLAELRSQTGHWADALALLRQAEADFPDQGPAIHLRLRNAFAAMVHDTATQQMRPLEFVAEVDDNADLLRDTDLANAVDGTLAADLLALDLPQRAEPVLEKLLRTAPTDSAKARYAFSLARLRLRGGDPAGALAVLDANQTATTPPEIAEDSLLLRADAKAQRGDPAAAIALLTQMRTPRATEARASLLENARDWPAAQQAWSDLTTQTVPDRGALTDAQLRTLVRYATATARAKDEATLATLRQRYGVRVPAGSLGDMFHLLTAKPIQTTADLARAGRETTIAAALPGDLKAIKAPPPN